MEESVKRLNREWYENPDWRTDDFPAIKRTFVPSTICGESGTIWMGLAGGVAVLNFSGYYDRIRGFNSSNTL